jgi:hypothetical protein
MATKKTLSLFEPQLSYQEIELFVKEFSHMDGIGEHHSE